MDSEFGLPRELSDLQKLRSHYQPDLPPCLQGTTVRVEFGDATAAADPSGGHTISRLFLHTFGQPLAHFLRANANVPVAQIITEPRAIRVGLIFCGRQSPGGHQGATVRVEFGDATAAADPSGGRTISRLFLHTFGQPLAHFLRANTNIPVAQIITETPAMRVGLVFCGRQSPGGHQGTTVRVEFGDATAAADPSGGSTISRLFLHTFGQPLAHFLRANANIPVAQIITEPPAIRVGLVFCGRQSPGGHTVIWWLWGLYDTLKVHNIKSSLLGFLGGSEGLFAQNTLEITDDILATYKNQGGYDMLGRTSEQVNAALASCTSLKLDGFVIVGGVTSNADAAYLAEAKCPTKVVGVPVTINGDLKNQFLVTNVGFDSLCKINSQLISNVCTDALSAGKYYYFIWLMGRKASPLSPASMKSEQSPIPYATPSPPSPASLKSEQSPTLNAPPSPHSQMCTEFRLLLRENPKQKAMEKPQIRASSFTACVYPRHSYLTPSSTFPCFIMEDCLSQSPCLTDPLYAFMQDGSHTNMFRKPNTCAFPMTFLAVYEPLEDIGYLNVHELIQNQQQQNDDYEEFIGDNPKLRMYNVRNMVECSRHNSLRIIGANLEGMVLFIDPRRGYVYVDVKTGGKIYLPPYDDVQINSNVVGTWIGTPGSNDCITIILDQLSRNKIIKARQYTESVGWICADLEYANVEAVDREVSTEGEIEGTIGDDEENVIGVEEDEEHLVYALIIHGERLHVLYGYNYACFKHHIMNFRYNLTDDMDLFYDHFSFVEDGGSLYLMMISPEGQYKILQVDIEARTLRHLPGHVFPSDRVVYTPNILGGKVLPAVWTDERNMIFATGGAYGEMRNGECIKICQGEQCMTILKVCPVSVSAAADGLSPPCECICTFIRHYEP